MPRWLLWTLLAIACWGVWAVIPTAIGAALSAPQQQALCTLGLIPLLAILSAQKPPAEEIHKRRGILLALTAGVCSALGNIPYFALLAGGAKAATVVPLTAMYPLVTVTLALVLLKERMNVVQVVGFVVSMAAIYLFNSGGGSEASTGILANWLLLALVPIALWGAAGLLQKMATNHVSGGYAAFWFHVAFLPIGFLFYISDPLTAAPAARTWMLVLLLGFTLALGNLAILAAFALGGRAAIITPMAGLYPLISLPIAMWRFHESIERREACGIFLALLAVGMLTYEYPVTTPAPAHPASDSFS
jgi:drug/metabolite transporter (DMT)-like permease